MTTYHVERLSPDQAELEILKERLEDFISSPPDDWEAAICDLLIDGDAARCLAEREAG